MNKTTLNLLLAGGLLSILLLLANPVFANSLGKEQLNSVNLSQTSPSLAILTQNSHPLSRHLGCSCAVCVGISQPQEI